MKKEFLVISHTHWDREWYMPFEKFRIRLCDLINNLFIILEKYPEFIFHLDAQTIALEDYLEVYPENRAILKKYITSGNIIVGPWYVQNDFYLSSGEATVRNLLIGTEIAKEYGKCSMIGYTPDQFGLPSQLPQILKSFGIDKHLFGRGYNFYKEGNSEERIPGDNEVYWESPDGSKVLSVVMPFWYNNAQHIHEDIDVTISRLDEEEEKFKPWTDAPYYIMMNGVDHLEAQENLLPILDELNNCMENRKITQTNMDDALEKLRPYAYKVRTGELRHGKNSDILSGTLSTRVDIKKLNFDAQKMLEQRIEPLYSMLMLEGLKDIYPQHDIRHMWKILIPNHAHDSICCCSNGNVMRHMKDRYLSFNEIGEELIARGCRFINHHIAPSERKEGEYYLTVINTSQRDFTGVIDVEMDINDKDDKGGFRIFLHDGTEIPYVVMGKEVTYHSTFSPLNLPGSVRVDRYSTQVYVENIPAFGYRNYIVKPEPTENKNSDGNLLENEYIKVEISDGVINLFDKVHSIKYDDIVYFEDVGDAGGAYVFTPVKDDVPIRAEFESMREVYNNELKSEVVLEYTLNIPHETTFDGRGEEYAQSKLYVTLSLSKGEKHLNVDTLIENNSKNHLLRAVIDTQIKNTVTYASSVYEITERDFKDINTEIITPTQPVNGYVYKKEKNRGLAVFTKGLYEYENSDGENIKLSLLRSTDRIPIGEVSDRRTWGVDDNLMLGKVSGTFAIMPFDGNDDVIHTFEENINSKPLYWFDSTDVHMFTGGRPVVQNSNVDTVYFPYDKYEDLDLPHCKQYLKVNDKMCVTALKKAETKDKVVLRVFNPKDISVSGIVDGYEFIKTDMCEEREEEFENSACGNEILSVFIGSNKVCYTCGNYNGMKME